MAEHVMRLAIWIICGVLLGLLPMFVAWMWHVLAPRQRDYIRDFYWEGALLFLGPAIVGELCAELTIKRTLFSDPVLSGVAIIIAFCVLVASVITYTAILTWKIGDHGAVGGVVLSLVKEVSDGVLMASAVFAFSMTAVLYAA